MGTLIRRFLISVACTGFVLGLPACGNSNANNPDAFKTKDEIEREENGSIFDWLLGGRARVGGQEVTRGDKPAADGQPALRGGRFTLGGPRPQVVANPNVVNESVWRASYELASVLPVAAANRRRGVIETDWYAPPGITNEQMRLVIFVGGGAITANSVKVNAFKRGFDAQGQVVQSAASPSLIAELENAILSRARQL